MNGFGIFSVSSGSCWRYCSDEWPVPKSSIAIRTPSSFSSRSSAAVRPTSVIRTVSVISIVSRCAGSPELTSAASTVSRNASERSWTLETFTVTGSPPSQPAAVRHASSSTHAPIGTIRPRLLGERDELARRHVPVARMVPAQERLGGAQRARLEVDDRLERQVQLVRVERAAEVVLQRDAGEHLAQSNRETTRSRPWAFA